jgi:hypothetical protein
MQCIFFLQSWCTNHIMPWWVYRENKYLKRKLTELSSFSLWSDMELHLYCYYIYTTEIKNNWITGSVLSLMSYPHVICKRSGYDGRFIKIAIWNMILPKMIFFSHSHQTYPPLYPRGHLAGLFCRKGTRLWVPPASSLFRRFRRDPPGSCKHHHGSWPSMP